MIACRPQRTPSASRSGRLRRSFIVTSRPIPREPCRRRGDPGVRGPRPRHPGELVQLPLERLPLRALGLGRRRRPTLAARRQHVVRPLPVAPHRCLRSDSRQRRRQPGDPRRARPDAFVAELAEVFMRAAPTNWNPGNSGGEALSRVAAAELHPTGYYRPAGSANNGPYSTAWLQLPWRRRDTQPDGVDEDRYDFVTVSVGTDADVFSGTAAASSSSTPCTTSSGTRGSRSPARTATTSPRPSRSSPAGRSERLSRVRRRP